MAVENSESNANAADDDETQQTKKAASKERARQKGVLVESKDRAQMTATTAMSFIHVALLKNLLNAGPDSSKYYTTVLSLIAFALGLQIFAGVLAITVANMKKHSDSHKRVAQQKRRSLCCWKKQTNEIDVHAVKVSISTADDDDAEANRDYDSFNEALLKSELQTAKAEVELAHYTDQLEHLQSQTGTWDTKARTSFIKRRIDECEAIKRHNTILHRENEILLNIVEEADVNWLSDLLSATWARGRHDMAEMTLENAKVRAQMTVISSMPIANIALLKNILDGGSTVFRFYAVLVTVLSLSLIMGFTAGLIAISIANLRSYFAKHREDPVARILRKLSCHQRRSVSAVTADDIMESFSFNDVQTTLMRCELQIRRADMELAYLHRLLGTYTKQGERSTSLKISRVRQQIATYTEIRLQNIINREKCNILLDTLDDLISEKISLWQNVMTYILYAIVVCNALVICFTAVDGDITRQANVSMSM